MVIPFYRQITDYHCGPACMQMVFAYYGKNFTQEELALELNPDPNEGVVNDDLCHLATKNGLYCYTNEYSSLHEIKHFISKKMPVVVNYIEPHGDSHYAVVVDIKKPWFPFAEPRIVLNDPWHGKNFTIKQSDFIDRWYAEYTRLNKWIMVISDHDLSATKQFFSKENEAPLDINNSPATI